MIDKIKLYDDQFSFEYDKNNMSNFFEHIYPSGWYFYNDLYNVEWYYEKKRYFLSKSKLQHHPTFNWDGIAFITNKRTIEICNEDNSKKHEILIPDNIIQLEDYETHINSLLFNQIQFYDNFKMEFQRFDGYHEIDNKKYLGVQVSKLMKGTSPYGLAQIRYLDTDSGEFLPFTKNLSYFKPNHHGYNEYKISLNQ
jgi:hypothetical protein